MFKLKNWNFESKEISYKGDIDSGRYDDGDFNSIYCIIFHSKIILSLHFKKYMETVIMNEGRQPYKE